MEQDLSDGFPSQHRSLGVFVYTNIDIISITYSSSTILRRHGSPLSGSFGALGSHFSSSPASFLELGSSLERFSFRVEILESGVGVRQLFLSAYIKPQHQYYDVTTPLYSNPSAFLKPFHQRHGRRFWTWSSFLGEFFSGLDFVIGPGVRSFGSFWFSDGIWNLEDGSACLNYLHFDIKSIGQTMTLRQYYPLSLCGNTTPRIAKFHLTGDTPDPLSAPQDRRHSVPPASS